MNLIEKVKAAIERENLIPAGASIIVGVSGGADSVALLHILHRLGYSLTAAHLNHSIRGAAADGDEAFVKALCKKLGVECVTAKTDVPALAKEKGISIEMAAREARHDFFRSLKSQASSLLIALAHHADDQLETFFLRAARGTGPGGLSGMRFFQKLAPCQTCDVVGQASLYSESLCSSQKQEITRSRLQEARPTISKQQVTHDKALEGLTLIRPMLGIRRAEIIRWLKNEKIEWREDATNTDETISRNFVRRQLLPMFGKLNDRAAENLLRTMDILRDEEECPEKAARRREIRDWLIEQGVKPDFDSIEKVIEFAAETDGSRSLDLEGLRIVNEYGALRSEERTARRSVPTKEDIRIEEGVGILRGPWCASVSLAKVAGGEVTVRAAQPGDRMEPYGMEGSKKLQDIFTDLKIPKAQRENWPVVECGGEIIWLPGYRIACGWELSSDSEPALHLFLDKS
ncbi:MAG: tRNA lysidine(34) synthetase TilS [Kiritimatiellales bacterium]